MSITLDIPNNIHEALHVTPLALHIPASVVGSWQAEPEPDVAQIDPAQQTSPVPASTAPASTPPSLADGAVQLAPSAWQTGAALQVSPVPPSPLGRHGEPPQH